MTSTAATNSPLSAEQSKAIKKQASKYLTKKDGKMKLAKLLSKLQKKLGYDCASFFQSTTLFEVSADGVYVKEHIVSDDSVGSADKKRKRDDGTASAADVGGKKEKKSKKSKAANAGNSNMDVDAWRKENKIVLESANKDSSISKKYPPAMSFIQASEAGITKALVDYCTETKKFIKPSPIQAQCWPILAKGEDVVGIAETGSGKTLAFAVPALSTLNAKMKKAQMLVLAPTRELAMQSHEVLHEFGALVGIKSIVIYGGVSKHDQIRKIKRDGPQCIIATPGRLVDLLQEQSVDLSSISHLVLDEADRMLDMGFEMDVRRIIGKCMPKEKRQTAMFSATWPAVIQELAAEFLVDPIRVYVGFEAIIDENGDTSGINDSLSANKRVKQTVEVIEDRARGSRLNELLRKYHDGKNLVLVFALYKKEAQRLEDNLKRSGFKCCSIHGDKNQESRTRALSEFKNGSCPILVATDVAARGLDIPNVEVVINYTFPLTIEDYVHRIGRTGRAGKTGRSHTFFQPGDKSHAGELQQVMRQAGQPIPEKLMAFGSTIKKKEHKLYGNFGPRDNGQPMKKATKIVFD